MQGERLWGGGSGVGEKPLRFLKRTVGYPAQNGTINADQRKMQKAAGGRDVLRGWGKRPPRENPLCSPSQSGGEETGGCKDHQHKTELASKRSAGGGKKMELLPGSFWRQKEGGGRNRRDAFGENLFCGANEKETGTTVLT